MARCRIFITAEALRTLIPYPYPPAAPLPTIFIACSAQISRTQSTEIWLFEEHRSALQASNLRSRLLASRKATTCFIHHYSFLPVAPAIAEPVATAERLREEHCSALQASNLRSRLLASRKAATRILRTSNYELLHCSTAALLHSASPAPHSSLLINPVITLK